jgi:hypothetical protein
MISLPIQEQFRLFITPHVNQLFRELNSPIQFEPSRVTLWADVDSFKFKEDAFVWGQKREKIPNQYSVYFDSIHVCYLEPNTPKDETLKRFWKGFLKAYALPDNDANKIWLDPQIYKDKAKEEKENAKKRKQAIQDAIKAKPVTSETQAIAKEIALDVAKDS